MQNLLKPSLLGSGDPNPEGQGRAPFLTEAQMILRRMVLDTVPSAHSKRNYATALDALFRFSASRPLTRALLMEYRASLESLAPSTINVRLAAIRPMVTEAQKNGMLGVEEAAQLTSIPNIKQAGTRMGNWLTREQAKEILAVPDRSILKGKRDYVILALLVGCALRRAELAELDVATVQQREGRWVLGRSRRQGSANPDGCNPDLGQEGNRCLARGGRHRERPALGPDRKGWEDPGRNLERLDHLVRRRAVRQTDRDRALRGT
jgi:integrase